MHRSYCFRIIALCSSCINTLRNYQLRSKLENSESDCMNRKLNEMKIYTHKRSITICSKSNCKQITTITIASMVISLNVYNTIENICQLTLPSFQLSTGCAVDITNFVIEIDFNQIKDQHFFCSHHL